MEQGKAKAPLGNTSAIGAGGGGEDVKMKKKMPAPEELISHYVSKGMDSQEASLKVIEDLQKVLFRVISNNSSSRNKPDRLMSRKLDTINNRLAVLDMKLDSKPGYPQVFAVGLASGAALNAITSFMPHLFTTLANIWNSVSSSSSSSSF